MIMNHFKTAFGYILNFALLGLLLSTTTACSDDTDSDQTKKYVSFLVNETEKEEVLTKGAQATLTALNAGFGVSSSVYPSSGTYSNYPCGSYFYKLNVVPGVATKYSWPMTDSKMAFYAYYPYNNSAFTVQSSATTNGAPTYSYTVPESIGSQVDVMTAQVVDRLASNQSAVALSFAHRCTDVRFTVYNRQSSALTIKSIAIYGVKYTGTYKSGTSWTLTGNANSSTSHPFLLTLNTSVASKATVDMTGTSNHFIMLPQTVASGTNFIVVKTLEDGEEKTYTHTLSENYVLEMGKSVTFKLTLGNEVMTVGSISVNEWEPITSVTGAFSVNNWTAQ